MRFNKTSRRLFLTGAGGAVLALPWLPSLLPRAVRNAAKAQAGPAPKRFVALKTYNDLPIKWWYPTSATAPGGYTIDGSDETVLPDADLAEATGVTPTGRMHTGTYAPMSDFTGGGFSRIFDTNFNPFLSEMLMYRGLDIVCDGNHNYGSMLGNFGDRTNATGSPFGDSEVQHNVTIDQVLARSSKFYPTTPSTRIFHLGTRTNTMSFAPSDPSNVLATGRGNVQQAQAYTNPRTAFDAVLGSIGGGGDPMEPPLSSRLIDRVIEDYRRASTSPNLGSEDRALLDQHMTRLSELEARLSGGTMVSCDTPTRPGSLDTGGEFEVDTAQIAQLFRNFVDLAVIALTCDVTRIVTIDIAKVVVDDGGDVFGMGDSPNDASSGRNNWHRNAHEWGSNEERWMGLGNKWVADNVLLPLLTAMDEHTEGDGMSMLHHSLVHWGSELAWNHANWSMPTATWGRAGGVLQTGRYLDYMQHFRGTNNAIAGQHWGRFIEGVQYNRFLNTVLQSMGLSPSDYEANPGMGFGEPGTGSATKTVHNGWDTNKVGDILPDIG